MNNLIFKRLEIIDIVTYEAFSIEFVNGVNIITSTDNSVGKSTILKSLYYVLGAEVKFGHRINPKNLLIILKFTFNNHVYTIMRNQNAYKVIEPNNTINSFHNNKAISKFLSELYGFKIEIEGTKNRIENAPSVIYYLPYYIDQMKGWQPDPENFENLGQFNKPKRDASLYFHLGILGDDYLSLINRKEELSNEKKDLNIKHEYTHNLLKIIEEEVTSFDISLNNSDELLLQKRTHLKKYQKYNFDANNIKHKLLDYKETLYQLNFTMKNIDKSVKNEESKKQLINETDLYIDCPNCEFEFNIPQNKLFKVNYNVEELQSHKVELLDKKSKLINEITKIEKELYTFSLQLNEIEQIQSENSNSLENIMKFKGLESTKNNLLAKLKEYTVSIAEIEIDIKKITAKITKINKQKSQIDYKYSEFLEEYFSLFDITEIVIDDNNRKKFVPSKTFSSDGANQIKLNLARLYSLVSLINHYKNGVLFPIVIDSPKTGEQSFKNNKNTLDNLVHKIKLDNQTIIATIDFEFSSDKRKFKLIKHSRRAKLIQKKKLKVTKLADREASLLNSSNFNESLQRYEEYIRIFTTDQ